MVGDTVRRLVSRAGLASLPLTSAFAATGTLYIGSMNAHLSPQSTVYSYSVSANTLTTYATGGIGAARRAGTLGYDQVWTCD